MFQFFGLFLLSFSKGTFFEGFVKEKDKDFGFGYISKFCFDVNHETHNVVNPVGDIEITLRSPKLIENMWVGLYDDQSNSWAAVYDNDAMTCKEVKERARNYRTDTEEIETKWLVTWTDTGNGYEWTEASPIVQNIRPRWWYVAVGSCASDIVEVEYDVHMVQSQRSAWNKEFGVNEMGLNTLYLVFFWYYLILIAVHSVGTYRLRKKIEYTHPLVKFFFCILLLQFAVVIAHQLHYGVFASNGWGIPGLNQFAEVAGIFVRIFFLIILMLLAKGWTISNREITGKKYIIGFGILFLISEVAILFWKYAIEDPAEVDVPLGLRAMFLFVMSFWFVWMIWFAVTVCSSYREEKNPPKKRLYFLLALIYIPWLFGLPFLTMLQFALDTWVREKVIAIFSLLISTVGYTFLAFLLWPTRAEDYFAITGPNIIADSGISNYEQL